MKETVELTRHGTTPAKFLAYVRQVIRLNDLSITVRLDDFDGMRIRVDYDDVKPEGMTDVEARRKLSI